VTDVTSTIGVVGLGAMGGRMARLLLEAGHALAVHDTQPDAMAPLVDAGAVSCTSPAQVANVADIVLASLPSPGIVRDVTCGEHGLIDGGAIRTFVDVSTTGAAVSEEVAERLRGAGIAHVDAPVSGGVAGLEARRLAIMVSGERDACEHVQPLLETFGRVFWVGPDPGQGQTAKVLNNLLSATAVAITAEALTLGARAGLDPATLLEIFNAGSGRNTATTDKFPQHVLTRAFASGFRLELMAKDVALCLGEARRRAVPMLVGGVVEQVWALAATQEGADADHTQLVELYERWTGTTIMGEPGRAGAHD
jgi:3-hydroxyisobutyrate dehydrogenase-like beta-hydroxyacid dehydrogenase